MKTDLIMKRLLRLFLVIATTTITIATCYVAIIYLYPFLLAFLLAFILQKPIAFIEKQTPMSRAYASFFVLVILFGLLASLFAIGAIELVQAFYYLTKQIPKHIHIFSDYIQLQVETHLTPIYNQLMSQFDALQQNQQQTIIEQLEHFLQRFTQQSTSWIESAFTSIIHTLQMIPSLFSICFFIFLGTFFICQEWYKLKNVYHAHMPLLFKETIHAMKLTSQKALFGYIRAQLLLTLISIIIIYLGLLVIGVDYSFTLALIIGLVDFIPYLGTGLFFIPWIGYLFLTGDYTLTIQLAILYGIIVLQRQLTEPKLLASQIGVNPLLMLMITFISFRIFGLFGIFLVPLFSIIIQALYQSHLFHHLWRYIKNGTIT
ncbi:sodium-lithium/proton antiporter [Paraliobacillus ryukyuensis]|uniref:Sporulation integral membrane protein YtvI n=1 Tax=Paraliobacillus ryukyuensis TaxID=200904 RepID=A0A366EBH9_9BACI|nr:sporulation integral membrane protein YtvI [Paraliobacillus ryukyuensis]RBO99405.1 sporulation integral membrane protein YtvI [Paraliobacillus ryukyuensis]